MELSINERINQVFKYSDFKSVRAFASHVGVAQTTMNDIIKGLSEPKFSTIQKLMFAFPLISPCWLILGSGDMFVTHDCNSGTSNIEIVRQGAGSNVIKAGGNVSGTTQGTDHDLLNKLLSQIEKLQSELTAMREQNTALTNKLLGI